MNEKRPTGRFLYIHFSEVVIVAKLTDRQRKKIIAERAEGLSIRALAKKYRVSDTTIRRTLESDPKMAQKVAQKKEENTVAVLAYMDSKKKDVCEILDKLLKAVKDDEKIAKTPLAQLATTIGILIDKFTAAELSGRGQSTAENNLLSAIQSAAKSMDKVQTDAEETP